MRTLIFAILTCLTFVCMAQPFFINREPKFEFVQDSSGTWRKLETVHETKISQPKGLVFTRDEVEKMISGSTVEKHSRSINRNSWLALWFEFGIKKEPMFKCEKRVWLKSYKILGDQIIATGASRLLVKESEGDWFPWAGSACIIFLFAMYVFALAESNILKAALSHAVLIGCAALAAYLPIEGWIACLVGAIIAMIAIPKPIFKRWNDGVFGITCLTSIVFCFMTRSISVGRGEFLIAMNLCSIILLVTGWIWYIPYRRAQRIT